MSRKRFIRGLWQFLVTSEMDRLILLSYIFGLLLFFYCCFVRNMEHVTNAGTLFDTFSK